MSLLALENPLPVDWQRDPVKAVVFGLLVMAWTVIMLEVGHWAGTLEEREYWAPLEAPPRKWPQHLRFLLRWWARLKGIRLPERRPKAPETLGRHRQPKVLLPATGQRSEGPEADDHVDQ